MIASFPRLGGAVAAIGSLIWLAWFLANGIDGPARSTAPMAGVMDLGLIALFGVQHSAMARRAARPLYVWASAAALSALCLLWQPIPDLLWQLPRAALLFQAAGIAIAVYAVKVMRPLELIGLKQGAAAAFATPSIYNYIRHPIYAGFLLAIWATPRVSIGRLLFNVAFTAYVLIGIHFEERGLVREFGEGYRDYQRRVPMLIGFTKRPPA